MTVEEYREKCDKCQYLGKPCVGHIPTCNKCIYLKGKTDCDSTCRGLAPIQDCLFIPDKEVKNDGTGS